jgi:hypothetical protein|tara:strand:- start:289 stop:489 length:201 start_codon:yes stop_codon:yes gene_type:complete
MQQRLSVNQILELQQGLNLRIEQLQKCIDQCNELNMTGHAQYYKNNMEEAVAMKRVFEACYNVFVE